MNVLYSGDAKISDGVIISALSLAKNVHEPLNIYIVTASLDYGTEKKPALDARFAPLLEIALRKYNPGCTVSLIDISEQFKAGLPHANVNTRFTPFCMLRLFADGIDCLPSKILYLDNDVICRGDPLPFYNTDIENAEMAGVLDHYGSHFFRNCIFKRDYVNSGVLLLNLGKIKESGLFKKARAMCVSKKMFMPDQSALNKLCTGQSKIICPRKYNEQRRLRQDTVFQHFTTSFRFFPYFHSVTVKPWETEKMHEVLNLHEYDALLCEYKIIKKEILQNEMQ